MLHTRTEGTATERPRVTRTQIRKLAVEASTSERTVIRWYGGHSIRYALIVDRLIEACGKLGYPTP